MKLALKVSEAAGDVPIIPHFMDDWPSTLYADGRLCGIPRKALVRLLRRVFQHAPLGFCIGKAMAEVFKARYGLDFYDFMNCVDDEEFEDNSCSCNSRPEHTVWAYVGGLHLNRWEPLVVLAGCLMTRRITLRIFIPEHDISEYGFHFSGFSNVEMGSLPPGAVMKAMKESDVLVHVESFNQEESEYTRYSVSTKLAQYLSSGRTVLGFGPAGLASVKLIEEAGAGISVVREDLNELARAVDKIANDARFRENCARQGILYASRHFKKSIVCRRFRQMLKPADVAIGKTVQNEVINKM
jgi:glycosyltransferase involved in cell wall biosynthesis